MSAIKSMTGFASYRKAFDSYSITVDIKTVNSRYLELYFKNLEDNFNLENEMRQLVKKTIARGKFECLLTVERQNTGRARVNTKLLNTLAGDINALASKFDKSVVNITDLLLIPNVLITDTSIDDSLKNDILYCFEQALDKIDKQRTYEGENLSAVILAKLNEIEHHLSYVKDNLEKLVENERIRLKEKLGYFAAGIDPLRLEQETVLAAQKYDIAEEYDRLCSHIKTTRQILQNGGIVGKKLDFMMQEFNRESNTIASKSSDISLTAVAVELKVLIEQMREQVQNIE